MSNKELPEHPNLLFIMTDQERYTQHFPPGWEENNLPNMQRLKRYGLSFTNAFTCASMCSPSRAAIFTGRYPSQTGVTKTFGVGDRFDPNRYAPTDIELNPEIPNLAKMLHNSKSYGKIHYRGKWHMSKGPDGVQQILPQQIDLYGFAGWKGPDGGQDTRIRNIGGGFVDNDTGYTQKAIKFINESANDDKPWCLVFSLINPHDIWTYPRYFNETGYYDDMLKGDIGLPKTINEDIKNNGKPSAQWQVKEFLDKNFGELSGIERYKYLNFYGNLMIESDKKIGQVLDALEKYNLLDSTIIVRTADHGEMGLAHGGLTQKMFNVYEETINIPLIISNPVLFPLDPGCPDGRTTEQLASTLDILPTLASLLNVEPPEGLRGVDLSPINQNPDSREDLRTEVLFTFDDFRLEGDKPSAVAAANRIRCVRTKEWKYARYFHADSSYKEEYEMYDLKNDKNEWDNVAWPRSPNYGKYEAQREMLAKLLADLEEKELPRKIRLEPEQKEG
jgi:choline-sulfatase